ncbi:hypothetical protein Dda_0719 [Drechslerella dactyloides]|uniref:Uncharacterized protein n=1 Tax=Drechslerella dactyloides TaxID=74499 RepID=A0AAD6J673_DREDA|nr:hypothetical protein Dda_0719 [Drechslerella dactyloides]
MPGHLNKDMGRKFSSLSVLCVLKPYGSEREDAAINGRYFRVPEGLALAPCSAHLPSRSVNHPLGNQNQARE